jgi:hypothetical protein
MTNEQRLRGTDAGVVYALLTTGYDELSVAALADTEFSQAKLGDRGAFGATSALYRTEYTLIAQEIEA